MFSRKTKKLLHPSLSLNDIVLKNSMSQKYLGLTLDVKLNFVEHIKYITQKISKNMGLVCRFQSILLTSSLLTIYKTFVRSHLSYADVIYDRVYNSFFHEKIRISSIQFLSGNNKSNNRTLSEKLYEELGLESLKSRRWLRKFYHFS